MRALHAECMPSLSSIFGAWMRGFLWHFTDTEGKVLILTTKYKKFGGIYMAYLDRVPEGRNRGKGRLLAITVTAMLAISLITIVATISSVPEDNPPASNTPSKIAYTPHAPIAIDGDLDFAAQAVSESWPGDGSAGNPYIIDGLDIDASAANGTFIANTSVHFIMSNCYVHDGGTVYIGISLFNCSMAVLDNNTCSYNMAGIYVVASINDTLNHNNCSNNQIGIVCGGALNSSLSDNTCSYNMAGIYLISSSNDTAANNTCSYNQIGIFLLQYSSDNTLTNNNCSYNLAGSIGIALMTSCNRNTMTGNNCSHDFAGISIDDSSDYNTVSNNTCSNNSHLVSGVSIGAGIMISSSSDGNTVSDNDCSNDTEYGIYVTYSSNNTVSNNTCNSNIRWGIILQADNNIVTRNTCVNNNQGIHLWYSDGNDVNNNTCSSNNYEGIFVNWSNGNTISDNLCNLNGYWGVRINSSSSNDLSWNEICNNSYGAVLIVSGSYNRIWNNTFIGNNGSGSSYDPSHVQACDDGTNNRWNTSGSPHGYGNYWGDLTTPDTDFNGIVDWSYNLTGSAGAKDFYPLTTPGTPIPEPSMLILTMIMMMIFVMVGRSRKGR